MNTVAIKSQQRLISADIRRRLFAPDMLLARGERQAKSAVPIGIRRFAHQPSGICRMYFSRVAMMPA